MAGVLEVDVSRSPQVGVRLPDLRAAAQPECYLSRCQWRSGTSPGRRPPRSAPAGPSGPASPSGPRMWPSKSTKKMYSGLAALAGNDSIQVRLILFCLNMSRASTSEPGLCGTRNMIAVLSLPGAGGFLMADDGEARLVVRRVLDVREEDAQAVPDGRLPAGDGGGARLLLGQLGGDRRCWPPSSAGRAARSCSASCGTATAPAACCRPGESPAARSWPAGCGGSRSRTSAQILSCGRRMNMSSVSATRPSVEFSSGTTPKSTWPRLTSSKTAAMLPTAHESTAWPKRSTAARWL